jgi:hypothetical protein
MNKKRQDKQKMIKVKRVEESILKSIIKQRDFLELKVVGGEDRSCKLSKIHVNNAFL